MPRVNTATSATQDKGEGLHPGLEVVGRHVLMGMAGQVQADHRHHRAGDHRRHEALNPAGADMDAPPAPTAGTPRRRR